MYSSTPTVSTAKKSSVAQRKSSRKTVRMDVIGSFNESTAVQTPNAIQKEREKQGLCRTCGERTHKITGTVFKRKKPITVMNKVENGRCLKCKPSNAERNAELQRRASARSLNSARQTSVGDARSTVTATQTNHTNASVNANVNLAGCTSLNGDARTINSSSDVPPYAVSSPAPFSFADATPIATATAAATAIATTSPSPSSFSFQVNSAVKPSNSKLGATAVPSGFTFDPSKVSFHIGSADSATNGVSKTKKAVVPFDFGTRKEPTATVTIEDPIIAPPPLLSKDDNDGSEHSPSTVIASSNDPNNSQQGHHSMKKSVVVHKNNDESTIHNNVQNSKSATASASASSHQREDLALKKVQREHHHRNNDTSDLKQPKGKVQLQQEEWRPGAFASNDNDNNHDAVSRKVHQMEHNSSLSNDEPMAMAGRNDSIARKIAANSNKQVGDDNIATTSTSLEDHHHQNYENDHNNVTRNVGGDRVARKIANETKDDSSSFSSNAANYNHRNRHSEAAKVASRNKVQEEWKPGAYAEYGNVAAGTTSTTSSRVAHKIASSSQQQQRNQQKSSSAAEWRPGAFAEPATQYMATKTSTSTSNRVATKVSMEFNQNSNNNGSIHSDDNKKMSASSFARAVQSVLENVEPPTEKEWRPGAFAEGGGGGGSIGSGSTKDKDGKVAAAVANNNDPVAAKVRLERGGFATSTMAAAQDDHHHHSYQSNTSNDDKVAAKIAHHDTRRTNNTSCSAMNDTNHSNSNSGYDDKVAQKIQQHTAVTAVTGVNTPTNHTNATSMEAAKIRSMDGKTVVDTTASHFSGNSNSISKEGSVTNYSGEMNGEQQSQAATGAAASLNYSNDRAIKIAAGATSSATTTIQPTSNINSAAEFQFLNRPPPQPTPDIFFQQQQQQQQNHNPYAFGAAKQFNVPQHINVPLSSNNYQPRPPPLLEATPIPVVEQAQPVNFHANAKPAARPVVAKPVIARPLMDDQRNLFRQPPPSHLESSNFNQSQAISELTLETTLHQPPKVPDNLPQISSEKEATKILKRNNVELEQLLAIIHQYKSNAKLQSLVIHKIWDVLSCDDDERMHEITNSGGVDAIVSAMKLYPLQLDLQSNGCGALLSFSSVPRIASHVANCSGVDVIVRAMRLHSKNSDVQVYGCGTLMNMAANPTLISHICSSGAIDVIIDCMRIHPRKERVQNRACGALQNLGAAQVSRDKIVELGGVDEVYKAMKAHKKSIELNVHGLGAMKNFILNQDALRRLQDLNGRKLVEDAQRRLPAINSNPLSREVLRHL